MERELNQCSEEDGSEIMCNNYELCDTLLPEWWFECKGDYLCTNCHMMFGTWGDSFTGKGTLQFLDQVDCPVCFEQKRGVSQPRCDHFICIDCFKRCYYGDEDGEPAFPYPEIEDEYYMDEDNPKWDNEYPLIRVYNDKWTSWENRKVEKYVNETNLRICPLCRK